MPSAPSAALPAFGDLIDQGQQVGVLPPGDSERLCLLLVAAMQGIAALVTSGRVQPGQVDQLHTAASAIPEARSLVVVDVSDRAAIVSGLDSEQPHYYLQHALGFQIQAAMFIPRPPYELLHRRQGLDRS